MAFHCSSVGTMSSVIKAGDRLQDDPVPGGTPPARHGHGHTGGTSSCPSDSHNGNESLSPWHVSNRPGSPHRWQACRSARSRAGPESPMRSDWLSSPAIRCQMAPVCGNPCSSSRAGPVPPVRTKQPRAVTLDHLVRQNPGKRSLMQLPCSRFTARQPISRRQKPSRPVYRVDCRICQLLCGTDTVSLRRHIQYASAIGDNVCRRAVLVPA